MKHPLVDIPETKLDRTLIELQEVDTEPLIHDLIVSEYRR